MAINRCCLMILARMKEIIEIVKNKSICLVYMITKYLLYNGTTT